MLEFLEQNNPIQELRSAIADEICIAMGISAKGFWRKLLGPALWPPTHAFARLIASVDHLVKEEGIAQAAKHLLGYFVDGLQVQGAETIPTQGALLIASNHPGAYDSVSILAHLPREDIKIVVSDVPFLHRLPNISKHLIFTRAGVHGRMGALREMIRHIWAGRALLIFSTGLVDSDPDLSIPGQADLAQEELKNWSPSLELILQKVPETKLLVTVVSGVLMKRIRQNRDGWQ